MKSSNQFSRDSRIPAFKPNPMDNSNNPIGNKGSFVPKIAGTIPPSYQYVDNGNKPRPSQVHNPNSNFIIYSCIYV